MLLVLLLLVFNRTRNEVAVGTELLLVAGLLLLSLVFIVVIG